MEIELAHDIAAMCFGRFYRDARVMAISLEVLPSATSCTTSRSRGRQFARPGRDRGERCRLQEAVHNQRQTPAS